MTASSQSESRPESRPGARSAGGLAIFLAGAGLMHFIVPAPYDSIVPRYLPGRARTWTLVSGAAELTVAAAVASPRTRRPGAIAAAGLFAAVLPANVQMAWDWRGKPVPLRVAACARLPLQVPLVMWALNAARSAGDNPGGGDRTGTNMAP
jgi:uncharacterized membrane protein